MKRFPLKLIKKQFGEHLLLTNIHRGFGFSLLVLIACSLVGFLFYLLGLAESNIITVYFVGVLVVSVTTVKMRYWIFSSIMAVLLFNCLYAVPRFTLLYYDPQHTVAMALLLITSLTFGYLSQQFRKRTEEKSALVLQAESERMRANLLRSIGHDLRTPLTGISGDAQILLSKGGELSDDVRLQLYRHILDNSDWLISMVENILSVTRLDNGKVNINTDSELLADLIDEALRYVSKKSAQHHIVRDFCDEMFFVNVDASLIIQVVVNMIDNAIKHTPEGSNIVISLRRNNNQAVLEVADDGPGIGEAGERVFEMFFSTDTAHAGEKRGMGLGLPLVKIIIEAHGGHVYHRENIPHGAVFGFTLPIERTSEWYDKNSGN